MGQTFGELLRAARYRAGFNAYSQFAEHLRNLSVTFSDEAIGNWERNERRPDRQNLLAVLEHLAGFNSLHEVRQLLEVGEYDPLSLNEINQHFSHLPDEKLIPNLPPRPYGRLFGRETLVHELSARLLDPRAPRLLVISGLGGIGKTALAHEVIRSVMQQNRFELVLWQSVKSEEFISASISRRQAVTNLTEALLGYARQLGMDEKFIRADRVQDALKDSWQSGHYLIVLDNLETLESAEMVVRELRDMLGDSPHSRILLTSRKRLAGESYLYDQPVRRLDEPDATAFLLDEAQQRGAESLADAGKALFHRVYEVTEGMPLAIKLIVTQYLLGIALDEELERLMGAINEEQLYRFIYFDIWHKLPLAAQKLLVGAASVPSSMQRASLMPASQLSLEHFQQAVPELVRASLMDVRSHPVAERQRYEIHAITRWFINIVLQGLWEAGRPSPV